MPVKDIALLNVFSAFSPCQRLGPEGDMAHEVKRIEIAVDLPADQFEVEPLFGEFIDDGLLAVFLAPGAET